MNSNFVKLGDLASKKGAIVSGPFGSNIGTKFFRESGVPLIRGNNLSIGCYPYFKEEGFVYVTEEKADELKNCTSIKDDIILTAAGTLGQTGMITSAQKYPKYIISNKQIRIRVDSEISDSLFVYYWLSSPQMKWVIESYNSGSTVPLINLSSVRRFPIPNFPLQTQKKISGLLSLIDSAIISSDLTSKKLESYISSLFRSWFIDFDPVKAKKEGKLPYGMDEETAALFPDTFEDSELGSVPTGWTVGMMEDVLSRKQDSTTPGEHLSERHYVPIENIASKSLTLKNWLPYNEAASSLILFSKNDLMFGAMRPYFHKVTIAPFDGITRSTCFVFTPKVPETLGFSLCLLNLESTIRYATDSSLGSTMPYAIWKNGLARHKIVLPPPQVMVAFSELIAPLIEKIRDGGLEIRKLSSTRDALLPRLMSGELEI